VGGELSLRTRLRGKKGKEEKRKKGKEKKRSLGRLFTSA
jgi:hypothetical protein